MWNQGGQKGEKKFPSGQGDKMVNTYHSDVQSAIIKFGNNSKIQKKVRMVFEGNRRPLSLVDPVSKSVVNYKPDVYYILRNNKKLIFEVLDSEEEKQDIIIADIIRSFLVENVEAVIFIYQGKPNIEKLILEALKTIYKGLVDKGIRPQDLPDNKKTGPYSITPSQAKNEKTILNKLQYYSIVWFLKPFKIG